MENKLFLRLEIIYNLICTQQELIDSLIRLLYLTIKSVNTSIKIVLYIYVLLKKKVIIKLTLCV